jgi:predicted nucleotidyltransferase
VAHDEAFTTLLDAMKRAAAVLRDNQVPFALAGGLAVYARGGPATEHDVDFIVREEDAEHALELLAGAGFRTERPPEGWLYKAYDDDTGSMIDLIFSPNRMPEVVPEILERAEEIEVYAITLNVMTVTDVLATKLLTLKEHEVDYEDVLEITRNCREQVEWDLLRERTERSPYAKAFFTLAEELGLAPLA